MKRVVEPEILDDLPGEDPEAIRSRKDLRKVNFLMGNERWILHEARNRPDLAAQGIVELGSGGGALAGKLSALGPVTAVDLADRPHGLAGSVHWLRGDLFEVGSALSGGILVASLFLHHFEADALARIGRIAEGFGMLLFAEPLRTRSSLAQGWMMLPFVGRVTRHDMLVSIRAGFVYGELPMLMGLGKEWKISERSTWRGGHRVLASRD